ncbi:MAG: histidine kinase [Bacteroidota bacterium]
MYIKQIGIFLFLLNSLLYTAAAQTKNATEKRELDSLQQVYLHTKVDTDRVKLSYLIGERLKNPSVAYWEVLLNDARQYNMLVYEAKILAHIGLAYMAQGNVHKAIDFNNRALLIAEVNGFKKEQVNIIKILEHLYAGQFDRKKSIFLSYKGLKIAEELNDKKSIIDFYSSLALFYLTSGEVRKALKIHFACLKICREIKYDFGISSALVDIGSDYGALNEEEKAVPYYLESLQYIKGLEGTIYGVQIYNSVCSAYIIKKNYDSAYYYANKAYTMAEEIRDKRVIASTINSLASISYLKGDNKQAKKEALQALAMAQSIQFTAQIPALAGLLKKIYLKEGNYKEALKIYELYIVTKDTLSNEKVQKEALEKEFAYNLEEKENQYKLLAQENEIQTLQLNQSRYFVMVLGILLVAILIITYLLGRQKGLKAEHQRVKLEQKLLISQMNPHFMFNCLNSIQQFIMSGQNNQAEIYLSKFSKLIRELLESSARDNLTVKEDLNILKAYLEMESLRFGPSFYYSIKMDSKIDIDNTYIPHLMIQPFVENAIWHGLLAKNDDGHLQIRFEYVSDKTIKCIIDDNGVGRDASLHKETTFKKNSLALSFVKQRIELIKKTYKIEGRVDIIDKKDANGASLGTTVIIILPILKS